jgi:hypothetical protein
MQPLRSFVYLCLPVQAAFNRKIEKDEDEFENEDDNRELTRDALPRDPVYFRDWVTT